MRGKRYEYPRYFFSNAQDGPRNIAVARRASVAILDEFIGPKS